MRILATTLALLTTGLLAGCSDGADPQTLADLPTEIQLVRDLPANLTASASVTGSADPLNFVTGGTCDSPTAQCFEYRFTVNASRLPDNVTAEQAAGVNQTEAPAVLMAATLTWPGQSDFDLYIFQDGQELLSCANDVTVSPVTNSESCQAELGAGEYSARVVAWSVAQDTFTLQVNFA